MRSTPASLAASFAGSARLLRERAAATIALGAGIVLALLSVCCGIGVGLSPWLLCELLALQLGQALGQPVPHRRAWISAGAILLGAVLLTASVGWLTWLGLGTTARTVPGSEPSLVASAASAGGLLASASALVTLAFVLPFFYAPLILIEARAGLSGAVLESARLVTSGGTLAHMALSVCVNAVQVLPVLLAALGSALLSQPESAPLWVLFSLPLLSVSVPFGQGMLVSAYAARRHELTAQREVANFRLPRRLFAMWSVLVIAPLLSFGLLGASLVRPSRLPQGELPASAESIAVLQPLADVRRIHPVGTALEISASPREVQVSASDGGGAGALPLRSDARIEALRVVRVRDRYGIELMQAGRSYVTWIDRAGVRQDDDLRARLLDRVPTWALLAMLAALLTTASALLPVLASLAELRRHYAAHANAQHAGQGERARALEERRTRILRRAYAAGLAIAPLSGLSLCWGTHAVL